MKSSEFGDAFKWGVSCSAHQIEGAYIKDGKGLSIWDVFGKNTKKIANSDHAKIACDFYHRYEEDIKLVEYLNIKNFRFSIAWSRIIPDGSGRINQLGVDFYNRVIDYCIACGITPWITLYHWDLPYYLELQGGWINRKIIAWFTNYVEVCVRLFGDRVKHWMVLNEPVAFTGAGYFLGVHAPGKTGLSNFIPCIHHATICQAEGARIIKNYYPDSKVGTTFSYSHIQAQQENEKDSLAAKKIDAILNRLFIEPSLGLGYPSEDLPFLSKLESYIKPGDYRKINFQFDFIGLQTYTREIVRHSYLTPFVHAIPISAKKRNVKLTAMNWEIYPESIYFAIKRYNEYPGIKNIIITENGAAFEDKLQEGTVKDDLRIDYLENHIRQVKKAIDEKMKINGYFVWSLTDNFEWAEGYRPRFGLVHVNFSNQQRTVKNSGKWYKNFLS